MSCIDFATMERVMRCAIALRCETIPWVEVAGYVASLLVFATFYMKTMIPLRITAISSNIAFIVYAFFGGLHPIFVLHSVLLPLNLVRTAQILRLKRLVERAAKGEYSVEPLRPLMKVTRHKAGEIIFRRGDCANRLYMLASGRVRLEEIDHLLEVGDLFGEIGLFSTAHKRTQTARALTNVELLWLPENELMQVCHRTPDLALFFLRLSTDRLTANAARSAERAPKTVAGLSDLRRKPEIFVAPKLVSGASSASDPRSLENLLAQTESEPLARSRAFPDLGWSQLSAQNYSECSSRSCRASPVLPSS
jgi:CRP/FNR family transcriptional regulator, cyclic AMP receptor protein